MECNTVVEIVLERTELSPRELTYYVTDNQGWFISESIKRAAELLESTGRRIGEMIKARNREKKTESYR